MSLIVERRRRVLDLRSVIVAVVVLLLGAAIGFGVGYEVKAHRTTSSTKTTASTPAKGSAQVATPAEAAGIAKFRSCLNSHGVKYPPIPGGEKAFSAQISKPPAGVAQSTYQTALRACYAAENAARAKAG